MERIGLIAGSGQFPIMFAQAAKERGVEVVALAFREETFPELEKEVERMSWIGVGQLGRVVEFFKSQGITKAIMAGKIRLTHLFEEGLSLDQQTKALLSSASDKRGDTLLKAAARMLSSYGIELMDCNTFLWDQLPEEGVLTKNPPTPQEWEDINFGREIAKKIAELGIGQTVVVKNKAILAIEAIEGTDEAILRGGRLGKADAVVVKVASPCHDMRFDIPLVGPQTVDSMSRARAKVLALEAKKTLLVERGLLLAQADREGISIVAIK